MQISINKEIRHYQEEIFLGLNLRQMICSGAAIAVAVAVYTRQLDDVVIDNARN